MRWAHFAHRGGQKLLTSLTLSSLCLHGAHLRCGEGRILLRNFLCYQPPLGAFRPSYRIKSIDHFDLFSFGRLSPLEEDEFALEIFFSLMFLEAGRISHVLEDENKHLENFKTSS